MAVTYPLHARQPRLCSCRGPHPLPLRTPTAADRLAMSLPSALCPQDGAEGFFPVWDHWLLDTLTSWQRQSEDNATYAIREDEDDSAGATAAAPLLNGVFGSAGRHDGEGAAAVAHDDDSGGLPPRKRPRADGTVPAALGVYGAVNGASAPAPNAEPVY